GGEGARAREKEAAAGPAGRGPDRSGADPGDGGRALRPARCVARFLARRARPQAVARGGRQPPNCSLRSAGTRVGSAFPFDTFITWPTKNGSSFVSPLR